MSFMPANLAGAPVFEKGASVEQVRAAYDRTHPGDTFVHLQRRARLDKRDKGLLGDWLALAAEREVQSAVAQQLDTLLGRLERI